MKITEMTPDEQLITSNVDPDASVMIYVDMEVNGVPLKAFVDSGAQSSIISKNCAERCGLLGLLDKHYRAVTIGVGQSEILGRIHVAPIKIGHLFYHCSFTVLNAPNVEFLFGLDMLRKHQCMIDLKENVLRMGGGEVSVPFLQEKDIPSQIPAEEKRLAEVASASQGSACEMGYSSATISEILKIMKDMENLLDKQDKLARRQEKTVKALSNMCRGTRAENTDDPDPELHGRTDPSVQPQPSRTTTSSDSATKGKGLEVVISNTINQWMEKNISKMPMEVKISLITWRLLSSPFTGDIEAARVPSKCPTFDMFKGDSDPTEHLMYYQHVMITFSDSDAILCKLFPATLKDVALQWFYSLEKGTIDCFKELAIRFIKRFYFLVRPPVTLADLMRMKRGEKEELRKYFQRFQTTMSRISNITPASAITTFLHTLDMSSHIYKNFFCSPPATLEELRGVVMQCAAEEEWVAELEKEQLRVAPASQSKSSLPQTPADTLGTPPTRGPRVSSKESSRPDNAQIIIFPVIIVILCYL